MCKGVGGARASLRRRTIMSNRWIPACSPLPYELMTKRWASTSGGVGTARMHVTVLSRSSWRPTCAWREGGIQCGKRDGVSLASIEQRRVFLFSDDQARGLYRLAGEGRASLHLLITMREIARLFPQPVVVEAEAEYGALVGIRHPTDQENVLRATRATRANLMNVWSKGSVAATGSRKQCTTTRSLSAALRAPSLWNSPS